jgi:hypothetical protein
MRPETLRLAGILLLAATAACHEAPTQPAPAPTPAPVHLDLSGKWTGTIRTSDPSCIMTEDIALTVSQSDTAIFFAFSTRCFHYLELDGTLVPEQTQAYLSGTLFAGNDSEIASMSGTATNQRIHLSTRFGSPITILLTR